MNWMFWKKKNIKLDCQGQICSQPDNKQSSGLVYVISAATMGRGDDELGWGSPF